MESHNNYQIVQPENIDVTIEVRRVSNYANSEIPTETEDIQSEIFENEETEHVNEAPEPSPVESPPDNMENNYDNQNNEPDLNENVQEEQNNLSETASAESYLFRQQETIITPGDSKLFYCEEEEDNKEIIISESFAFKFTPAENDSSKRPRTAPARKLTEMEEFRGSTEFLKIEAYVNSTNGIILKLDGNFDLDSMDGYNNCKTHLNHLEALLHAFKAKTVSRKYRNKFSHSYKILFQEGHLSYLPEILDSAQERFPYILVNSEKYIFSPNVLKAGEKLATSLAHLRDNIREIYNRYSIKIR